MGLVERVVSKPDKLLRKEAEQTKHLDSTRALIHLRVRRSPHSIFVARSEMIDEIKD
jgi:hypothetical protein